MRERIKNNSGVPPRTTKHPHPWGRERGGIWGRKVMGSRLDSKWEVTEGQQVARPPKQVDMEPLK